MGGERGKWTFCEITQRMTTLEEAARIRDAQPRKHSGLFQEIKKVEPGHWRWDDEQKCLVDYEPPRIDVNAPMVITDEIPGGIKSMADRKYYTSKRKLRDAYRRLGYEEVGNDPKHLELEERTPSKEDLEKLEADIARAYYDVRDGNAELTELDKHRCEIMNRNLREYNYDNRERDELGNLID